MPPPQRHVSQEQLIRGLLSCAPSTAAHLAVIRALLALVPIPNHEALADLVESVLRLTKNVAWTSSLDTAHWPDGPALNQLKTTLSRDPGYHPVSHHKQRADGMVKQYGVFFALQESPSNLSNGLDQMRVALLVCLHHWQGSNRTVAADFASWIRAIPARAKWKSRDVLDLARDATSPTNLVERVGAIDHGHQSLADAWNGHIAPTLLKVASVTTPDERQNQPMGEIDAAPAEPQGLPCGSPTRKAPQAGRADDEVKLVSVSIARRLGPSDQYERGEAPGDVVAAYPVIETPPLERTGGRRLRAISQANQAIWSRNSLLLIEHPDSLNLREATLLGSYLLKQLEAGHNGEDHTAVRRTARLAILLATGRSPKVLSTLDVRPRMAGVPLKPDRWELALQEGCFRQSVLHPDAAFAPEDNERDRFEQTASEITLPLPPRLAAALRSAAASTQLSGNGEDITEDLRRAREKEITEDLRRACGEASVALTLDISSGQVRRTLSCFLQHQGRDIASAQLITNDTFGNSTAPLYYYSPRPHELQHLYVRVIDTIFGTESPWAPAEQATRVGASSLVTPNHYRQMAKSLGTASYRGLARSTDSNQLVRLHNGLVDHIVGMLLNVVGHRPTDALFTLTRGDVDLDGGGAIFSDKRVDPAHWARFAVLPPIVTKQLKAYLSHLRGLGASLAGASTTVRKALAATAPLLFRLDASGQPIALNIAQWRSGLPSCWCQVPLNIGRAWIATRGRELGARAESLSTHLGHLEAAGFPFGHDSPTVPIQLAEELGPTLDALARTHGWKCRKGCPEHEPDISVWEELGPLRDWKSDIERHEAGMAKAMREMRSAQRAQYRSHRQRGEINALQAIGRIAPTLESCLSLRPKSMPSDMEILSIETVAEIQEALKAEGDLSQTIANLNALRRLLTLARERYKWEGYVPGAWRVFRRPESSPFFNGMMQARTQIEELRRTYPAWDRNPPGDGSISSRDWAFAKTAAALALFGFIDDPSEIAGLLERRSHALRIDRMPHHVLLQWQDEPRAVSCLTGPAALSLGALAKRFPEGSPPSLGKMDAALRRLMPKGATGKSSPMANLCSTMSVARRIELSGAARLALDPITGSIPAEVKRQVAWLDGDAASLQPHAPSGVIAPEASARATGKQPTYKQGRSRKQYKMLVNTLSATGKTITLPLTGATVEAASHARSRTALANELQAWVDNPESNEVVAALALWSRTMLVEGTQDTIKPAFGTVHTYLTSVGGFLVALTENMLISDLDEPELTRIYLDIVEMKTAGGVRARAAREILNFHRTVAARFQFPEIDEDEFAEYLRETSRSVDAELILPQERDAALDYLSRAADLEACDNGISTAQRRARRQERVLLELEAASAARNGEIAGMRYVELVARPNFVQLDIRPNRHRTIKTTAGRRTVDVTHRLPPKTRTWLATWAEAESQRMGTAHHTGGFLFSSLTSHRDLSGKAAIRDGVAGTLVAFTGRPSERLHRLRHLGATESLMAVCLPDMEFRGLGLIPLAEDDAAPQNNVLFPRDLHRQTCLLGHRRPQTTLTCYLHFPWVPRARSDRWIAARLDRRLAAAALGVSTSAVDNIVQRAGTEGDASLIWLNHVIRPRHVLKGPPEALELAPDEGNLKVLAPLTTWDVGRVLGWTEKRMTPEAAVFTLGGTKTQLAAIRRADAEFAAQMMPRRGAARREGNPIRRNFASAKPLLELWHIADRPEDDIERRALMAVVADAFAMARPSHDNAIVLHERESGLLTDLLHSIGFPAEHVSVGKYRSALMAVQIARPSSSHRYLGHALKRIVGVIWVAQRIREGGQTM